MLTVPDRVCGSEDEETAGSVFVRLGLFPLGHPSCWLVLPVLVHLVSSQPSPENNPANELSHSATPSHRIQSLISTVMVLIFQIICKINSSEREKRNIIRVCWHLQFPVVIRVLEILLLNFPIEAKLMCEVAGVATTNSFQNFFSWSEETFKIFSGKVSFL